jgi:hypothetical protein
MTLNSSWSKIYLLWSYFCPFFKIWVFFLLLSCSYSYVHICMFINTYTYTYICTHTYLRAPLLYCGSGACYLIFLSCVCVCVCVCVARIELRALHLQGRCFTLEPHLQLPLPFLFALVIFELGSHFLFPPDCSGLQPSYFILPAIAGMIGMHHCAQLSPEMGCLKLFAQIGLRIWSSQSQPSQ